MYIPDRFDPCFAVCYIIQVEPTRLVFLYEASNRDIRWTRIFPNKYNKNLWNMGEIMTNIYYATQNGTACCAYSSQRHYPDASLLDVLPFLSKEGQDIIRDRWAHQRREIRRRRELANGYIGDPLEKI